MDTMTETEWRAFLSAGDRHGIVGIVRADGRPHVTPVWFVLDGDDLVFTTDRRGVKAKALRRDPRLSLCVDDPTYPYAYVMVEGAARRFPDDDAGLRHWTTVVGRRYLGAERAEEYAARVGVPPEMLVRVRIHNVIAHTNIAG